jgi:hypothetical protein
MKVTIAAILVFLFEAGSYAQQAFLLGFSSAIISAGRFFIGTEVDGEHAHKSPVHRFPVYKPSTIAASDKAHVQHALFDPKHRQISTKSDFSFYGKEKFNIANGGGRPFRGFGRYAALSYGDENYVPVNKLIIDG